MQVKTAHMKYKMLIDNELMTLLIDFPDVSSVEKQSLIGQLISE